MTQTQAKILHRTVLLLAAHLAACSSQSPSRLSGTECEGNDCLDSETGTGGDADTDSDTDTDADADSDTQDTGEGTDTSDGSDKEPPTDSDADADTDTDGDSDTDTDGDADTDTDGDSDTDTDGDGDTDTDTDGDADADADTDADSDTQDTGGGTDTSDTSDGSDKEPPTDTDTDTGTEPEIDTLSELDSNSDGYVDGDTENACPDGQHEGCYGGSAWCLDNADEPQTPQEECTSGEKCVLTSEGSAMCICMPHTSYQCYAGDVWAYDSCGNFDGRESVCTETAPCTALDDKHAACCEQNVRRGCGLDGHIHYYDACGMEGEIAEECDAELHLACQSISASEVECGCANHWEGDNCDVCPGNWNPDKGCNECHGYWVGDNCETCEGFGDLCQCPDDTFVPQPSSRHCWTCPAPYSAAGGQCEPQKEREYSQEDTRALCPPGFSLPSIEQLSTILEDCSPLSDSGSGLACSVCADGASDCNAMYGNLMVFHTAPLRYVWTSTECTINRMRISDIATGLLSEGLECSEKLEAQVICVDSSF